MKDKAPLWAEKLPELPELVYETLKRSHNVEKRLTEIYLSYSNTKRKHATAKFLFGVGATLVVCSAVLQLSHNELHYDLSLVSAILGTGCWVASWLSYRK